MRQKKIKKTALMFLIIYTVSVFSAHRCFAAGDTADEAFVPLNIADDGGEVTVSSRFMELLFGKEKKEEKEILLIPGGDVFGIKINEPYVVVSDAKDSTALKRGDKIVAINGKATSEPTDVQEALKASGGKALKINVIRGSEEITLTVTPKCEENEYRLGVTLRSVAAGIGTVTYIDPKTGSFGGLGHGVCEAEDGSLAMIEQGEVSGVVLGGVKRGECGKPGELSGVLNKKHCGEITMNNECGVFGILDGDHSESGEAIPIGRKSEIHTGKAEIISTVKSGKTARYNIEISEIDQSSNGSKSFKIKVTDPTLITLTGGIVRGMSGSPIIQDGKLVGAVTHVLINDPTTGYGIFIENMLNAAQMPMQKAS